MVIRITHESNLKMGKKQLESLVTEVALPDDKIIMFVFSYDSLPDNNVQGACVPRPLLKYSRPYASVCGRCCFNWDICIAISGKYCDLQNQYPAYFTYLIGHELGHAKICFYDLNIHKYYCLIEMYFKNNFQHERVQYHEFPHERLFDKFGIFLCEKLKIRDKLNTEIGSLISKPTCKDRERLEWMQSTAGSGDLDHLREELIIFSKPYKTDLISYWKKEKEENGDTTLANEFEEIIKDYLT